MTLAILALITPIIGALLPLLARWIGNRLDAAVSPIEQAKRRESVSEQAIARDAAKKGAAVAAETSLSGLGDLDDLDDLRRIHGGVRPGPETPRDHQ